MTMKSCIINSLMALSVLASAHVVEKRDTVWVTRFTEVVETTYETATVWVPYPTNAPDSGTAAAVSSTEPVPAAPAPLSGQFEPTSDDVKPVSDDTEVSLTGGAMKPSNAAPANAQSSAIRPVQSNDNDAGKKDQSLSPALPPKPESVSSPARSSVPAPARAPAPAPASAPVASTATSEGSGQTYSGEMTYYDPGLGSCGITSSSSEPIVAISHVLMDAHNTGNPNANVLCGKTVNITYNGKTTQAKVVDRCVGCAEGDLDMSSSLFQTVAGDLGQGRVSGMTWNFAD